MVYSNNIYEQYFYCIYKQMFSFNAKKIKNNIAIIVVICIDFIHALL